MRDLCITDLHLAHLQINQAIISGSLNAEREEEHCHITKHSLLTCQTFNHFQFANLAVKVDPADRDLAQKIFELRSELRTISMQDEFAKYAKIERQIIKLTEERKKFRKLWLCSIFRFPGVLKKMEKKSTSVSAKRYKWYILSNLQKSRFLLNCSMT